MKLSLSELIHIVTETCQKTVEGLESTAEKISMIVQVLTLVMSTTEQDIESKSRALSPMELDEDPIGFILLDWDTRTIDPLYRKIAADIVNRIAVERGEMEEL